VGWDEREREREREREIEMEKGSCFVSGWICPEQGVLAVCAGAEGDCVCVCVFEAD
jgi:hypothetical protein